MKHADDEDILSEGCFGVSEVALKLALSRSTVYRLLDLGVIPSIKIGDNRRIPVKGLRELALGSLVRGDQD